MPLREILRAQFAFLFFRPARPNLRDHLGAYLVSYIVAPVTLLGYVAAIVVRWRATRKPPRGLVPGPKNSNLERADTKD